MTQESSPADLIRARSRGFRVSFSNFGGTRKLSEDVMDELAEKYGADKTQISATKRLLSCKHPIVKLWNEKRRDVNEYFKARTWPSPRPGVRLLRLRGKTEEARNAETNDFLLHMDALVADYKAAIDRVSDPSNWQSIVSEMSEKLGGLFVASDYPSATKLKEMLSVEVMPEELDLPDYYRQLSPEEYARAAAAVQARFEAVVKLQEAELLTGLRELVDGFREKMVNYHDGPAKRFTNSAVTRVREVLEEFKNNCKEFGIGVGGIEAQLNKVVDLLSHDRHGNKLSFDDMAQELREDSLLAKKLVNDMGEVSSQLASLAVNTSRRSIIRRSRQETLESVG